MSRVTDRRTEPSRRFLTSRQRFIKRYKKQIREAIENDIDKGGIRDADKGEASVNVPRDGLRQPRITHGQGGVNRRVMPGNKEFNAGDRLKRPSGGGGKGPGEGGASDDGDGMDEFQFVLTEEERQDILFEDMALPNMIKEAAKDFGSTRPKRAGFVNEGPTNKLDLQRSKQKQIARHKALSKPLLRKMLEALTEQRSILTAYDPDHSTQADQDFKQLIESYNNVATRVEKAAEIVQPLRDKFSSVLSADDQERMSALDETLEKLQRRMKAIPIWNESFDMRFRHHEQVPNPTTQAVMFCLMDVSGSMTQDKKNNAKLFYNLLYRFLERNYENVDIVFVRHDTKAEEVDEQTFFYDQKTGGTIVSTAIHKMREIMEERYPAADWNIYGAQASDGDNWDNDSDTCESLLRDMMKDVQAYFYTEVEKSGAQRFGAGLWDSYETLAKEYPGKFFMGRIEDRSDIYPVFREFFQKRESGGPAMMINHSERARPEGPSRGPFGP